MQTQTATEPANLETLAAELCEHRQTAVASGHNCERLAIGISPARDFVRLCDDSGAYDFRFGEQTGRAFAVCVGAPSRAAEHIALLWRIAQPGRL